MLPILLSSCRNGGGKAYPDRALVEDLISLIDSSGFYRNRKELALEEKKHQLASMDPSSREWLSLCISIANEYSNYIADSSIVYCNKALSHTGPGIEPDLFLNASMCKFHILNKIGYFVEARLLLDSIKPSYFPADQLWRYYSMYSDFYHSLYTNRPFGGESRRYFTECYKSYRDTLISMLPPDSSILPREQEKSAAREGRFEDALKWNDIRLERLDQDDLKGRSLALYDRHAIYRYYMKRPVGDHVEYLLESAILDIISCNQDIASLRFVEAYLISVGDVSSAKIVSDYYYSTMLRFGSRTRLLDALGISMQVNDEYSVRLKHQKRLIQISLMGIVLLLLTILFILSMVLDSRRHITELNQDLERSSRASLSYVLGFFNLYSSYLSRILALRSKINTSLRKGNINFARNLTDPSKDFINEELKTLYSNFDKAFLDIFPNYVESFNALLKEEYRIVPKSAELLNTDLRIFAIIKLGITDSAKISELLHCSIKTVYNKRSEINSKLAIDKDDFMKRLMEI